MMLDVTVQHEELEEATGCTDSPGYRGGRQTISRETRNPLAQISPSQILDCFATPSGPIVETSKVPSITLERVARQSLLYLQVSEKFSPEVSHSHRITHSYPQITQITQINKNNNERVAKISAEREAAVSSATSKCTATNGQTGSKALNRTV